MPVIRTSGLFEALRGERDLDEAITDVIEDCYCPDPKEHSNRVESVFDGVCKRANIPRDAPTRLDLSERATAIWQKRTGL